MVSKKMTGRGAKKQASSESTQQKGKVNFTKATQAKVEEIMGRTGTRGEAIQVRCKILEGRDQNKIMRRNIKGPIKIGDILMLRETEIEAKTLTQKKRGKNKWTVHSVKQH